MIDQVAIALCAELAVQGLVGAGKAVHGAHRATQDRELERALTNMSLATTRLTVLAGLKEKSVRDADAERVMSIFRSDTGVEAVRQIVIYNLAVTSNSSSLHLLTRSVQAFLSLNEGREASHHLDAASVLTTTLVSAMNSLKVQLKASNQGEKLYRDLQEEARHRRLETALLGEAGVTSRICRISKLMDANVHLDPEGEKDYTDKLLSEHSEIEVPTLSSKQVSLPFEDGYVMPTVTFKEAGGQEATSTSLYDYVVQRRNVVILGDPGAGKSTGIKHLAREFISRYESSPHSPLPFLVTLRHYAEAQKSNTQLGFLDFISQQLSEEYHSVLDRNSLLYLLHVGRAVIFFDGFDEVIDFDLRKKIASSISRIANAFPSSIFVTTARQVGYDQNPVPRFNNYAYVGPLDDAGVCKFVDNYLATTSRQGDLSSVKFMLETADIADLRSSPLLLGVLCSLYSNGRTMPNNRVELYSKCGEMIFDAWDSRKSIIIPFDHRQAAEDAVKVLALKTFRDGVEEIRESELRQFLGSFYHENISHSLAAESKFASDTLDRWKGRMWILVYAGTKDGEDYFRFAHRSFLEFFAAQQTVYMSEDGTALWKTLKPHLEKRVAISYSLICVELLGARSLGALDSFYKKASTRIRKLGSAGKTLEGLNLATSAFEALACTRSNPEPRRALMIDGIAAFAQAIPYVRLSDPDHLELFNDGIGYSRVFNVIFDEVTGDVDDSLNVEKLGTYSVGDVTIQGAASIFQSFAKLRDVDRDGAVSSLIDAVRLCSVSDLERALRLTMTIQQIPAFETWGTMRDDLREALSNVGSDLWEALTAEISSELILEIDDLWLRIALLRNGKPGWGELLGRTSLLVFFESGWPFPVSPSSKFLLSYRPSIYLVTQAMLGVVDDASVGEVLASESERQTFARAFTLDDQDFCFSVRPEITPGFMSYGYAKATLNGGTEPSDLELWVSFCLLLALDRLGDRAFIESLVAALKGSSSLTRMINLRDRVRSRGVPAMFLGENSDIDVRSEAQVRDCLNLFETISILAGSQS